MASEKKPKVQKPQAPMSGKLPELSANCEWDTTDIGPYSFAIPVPKNTAGMIELAKSESKAVGLFARAWRILVPQQIGARDIEKSKMDENWARTVQEQILGFDPAVVRTRAPRAPKSVSASPADLKKLGVKDHAALAEFLKAQGLELKVVQQ